MIIFILFILVTDEALLFETEETRDLEVIMRDLEYLRRNPVDINTAEFKDLTAIPFLSMAECLKIIEYRKKEGKFNVPRDLLNIPGFDRVLLDKIKPFITIKAKPFKLEKLLIRLRLNNVIPAEKYSEEYYTKSELALGQHNLYLVTEKDNFERSFLDYYSSGIIIDEGIRKFVLGKYNLDLGAGVVLSPIGSFFQTKDFRIITREPGVITYTNFLENNGFFGAALSDSLFLKYTLFYSNQPLDGRVDSLGFARSFDDSGEHTDSVKLSRKDRINEEMFGYDIKYRFSNLLISNRGYWCSYQPAFACSDSFRQFYGENFLVTALDLKYYGDFFLLFSECARSYKNRIGGLFGFSGFFTYFDINLAGKFFPDGFYSPKGIEARNNYIGGVATISKRSKIVNIATTLTMDNSAEADSAQYGLKLNFEKRIGIVNTKIQIRWRYKTQNLDLSGSRVLLRIKPIKNIFCDMRLEDKYVYDVDSVERGIFGALEMGVEYKILKLRMRYGMFDTDTYASRIYAYEVDLPGVIKNRMLYYKGNYGFIYFSIKPIRPLRLSFKYTRAKRDTILEKQYGAQVDIRL